MRRVGFGISDQSSSTLFKFEEGRGSIADMDFVRGDGPFNSDKLVARITIQRLGRDGKPVDDEPVVENLNVGPITKFHAANASSADDPEPEDLGEEDGAVGNCFVSLVDKGPDKKAKVSLFGQSLEEKGVRAALLNGYAPNLIGMDADFAQLMTKYEGTDGGKDGTCLIVKKEGNIYNLAEINKRAGTGGGSSAAAAGKSAAPAKPAAAQAPAKPVGTGKVNGAPSPTAAASASSPASAPANSEIAEEADALAKRFIANLQTKKETIITRQQVGSKVVVMLAREKGLSVKLHKPVQALISNPEWFAATVAGEEGFGWEMTGDTVTIPALAE